MAKGLPGDARSLVDVTPCITSDCCCVPRPFVTVPVPPLPCPMQSSESVAVRVGINGFGRIGRLVTRAAIAHPNTRVVAINVGAPVVFTRHPTCHLCAHLPTCPFPPLLYPVPAVPLALQLIACLSLGCLGLLGLVVAVRWWGVQLGFFLFAHRNHLGLFHQV